MEAAERNGSEGGADPAAPDHSGKHKVHHLFVFQFCACHGVTATCGTCTGRRQLQHRHSAPPTHVAPLKHQFKPGSDFPSIFQQICETNLTAKSNPLLLVSCHSQIYQFCFLLNITIEGERGEGERKGIMTCSSFCFGWFFSLKQQGEATEISSLCNKILILFNTSGH